VAQSICTSPLVKTALYGKDANWGRIVCAIGYSGVKIVPEKVSLKISGGDKSLSLFQNGMPNNTSEEIATRIFENKEISIAVDLAMGNGNSKMYTCDLSHEYISVNANYRS
jgi:glutamate N-acetyltransferase/amino-acid N-acetyltransferase